VLVDYGCGSMPYRVLFEPYVSEYKGVDLPRNTLADHRVNPAEATGISINSADIVLSTEVLEHVEQPNSYLAECHRLLKTNGLLILSTHGYWIYHPDPEDFWRWTGPGLHRMVERVGFRVIDFRGLMGLSATAVHLLQDGLMLKLPQWIRSPFALFMQTLARLLDRIHSREEKKRDACVFALVAQKVGM